MSDVNDKIVDLFQHKAKTENLFTLQRASADVQHYENVVRKSVDNFHTYSVQEKMELYSSLAEFNVEILKQLLEYKKGELV
jgi:hypothetical protein